MDDPNILRENLRHREIATASRNLEGTYVMRLFAEFETRAREYWDVTWGTEVKTVDLLNGLAARRGIPELDGDNAHLVRDYRNSLVHEREDRPDPIPVELVRKYLCTFFSFLPAQW
jgi:hypothetical protein